MIATPELQTEEAALVRAAQGGDRAAFASLYRRYGTVIHAVLLTRVRHPDADDLTQEVFLKAMERLNGLRKPEAFAPWLFAIARRLAVDYARDRKITSDPSDLPAAKAELNEQAFAVLETIRKLPEAYRDSLTLRLVEGMTGPEIAERTGMTPDSVRVNLCRGFKLLRERLDGKRT